MSTEAQGQGTGRKVIVGVDGSELSNAALTWAVEEAELRGIEVHAVTAWWIPGGFGDVSMVAANVDYEAIAGQVMDAAIQVAVEESQAKLIQRHLVEGNPAKALIELASPQDIIVVGSHGHGGFMGALIGSVSQRVAAHAPCPVVIVRHPKGAPAAKK